MLLLPVFFLLSLRAANAQNTNVVCPDRLDFLENVRGQSPCVVTSTLFGACTGRVPFNLTALGDNFSGYAGPTSTDPGQWQYNRCLCSNDVYNLIQGCQDCQGKQVIKFESWTASCNSSFVGTTGYPVLRFPLTIPSTTVIPPWALINNIGGIWTESQAYDNATATTTASGTPSNTSPSDDNGKKSSTPVGAIVGGVIGGVAVLAAIGVAFFFLRRRSNAKQEPRQLKPQMGQVNAFNPSTAPSLNSSPFTPPPASEASYPSRFYPGSPPARTAYTTQHSSHGHSHSHESQPMLGPGGVRQGSPDIDASGRVIPEIQSEDLAMPDTYESYGRR